MYKVLHRFYDLKDNNHAYFVGDVYPRKGGVVGEERIGELLSVQNKMGIPLIEEIPEKPKKKAVKKVVETEE
jgi:hypothetical protein